MSQSENQNYFSACSQIATQEIRECSFSDDETVCVWGRLFPLGRRFRSLALIKEKYTFGRGDECDYSFICTGIKNHPNFNAYSKFHFVLTREQTSASHFTFLEDLSSNGTYVNGTKVGKGNKQVLNNNDEISLLLPKNKAFVYIDENTETSSLHPQEVNAKYTICKVLGSGACGEVRLAFSKGNCQPFAIKIISKKKFSVNAPNLHRTKNITNEVKILKALKHPCIIKIQDVIDTEDALYIVLEFIEGGELFDRVTSKEHFDEPTAKLLFYQMVLAIKYLHDQEITHRDLKPENILLSNYDDETVIKVTDFGLSKFINETTMLKTFCGTPTYLAPEIILTAGSGSYTKAIDCWSLGVILFICLSGYPPFSDDYKDMTLGAQIIKGRYTFPNKYWKHVSKPAINLIERLLTVDPEKRITLAEALEHPWLQDEVMIRKVNYLIYPELKSQSTLKRQRSYESDNSTDSSIMNEQEIREIKHQVMNDYKS